MVFLGQIVRDLSIDLAIQRMKRRKIVPSFKSAGQLPAATALTPAQGLRRRMRQIDVSVVIPTFRREREVCEAIRSALDQKNVSVECIVLDDSSEGSAEESVTSIGDSRVRYVKRETPSRGLPAIVRNEGAAMATGRYLHFLDDDDHLCDGALGEMVAALDAHPDKGIAIGWVVPFGDDQYWLKEKTDYFTRAARIGAETPNSVWTAAHVLFIGTLMVNSACLMRRECFFPLGGFDPKIPVYEDVDMWMRALRRYGHLYVNRPVLHYRVGQPSLMKNLGVQPEAVVHDANTIIHRKYISERGRLEYRTLQVLTKLLPFRLVRRIPTGKR